MTHLLVFLTMGVKYSNVYTRTVLIFIGIVMRTRSLFLNSIIDYMLAKQYSLRSVDTYLKWIAGFINYHDKRLHSDCEPGSAPATHNNPVVQSNHYREC